MISKVNKPKIPELNRIKDLDISFYCMGSEMLSYWFQLMSISTIIDGVFREG